MPDDNKTGITHEISLKKHNIPVIQKMRNNLSESETSFKSATDHYNRVFKKALRDIKKADLSFHNLRDTFAIRCYLDTRDIYKVYKALGNSTVKMT